MSIFDKEQKVKWFTRVFAPRYYDVYLLTGENFWFYEKNPKDGYGFTGTPGGGWRDAGIMASGGTPDNPVYLPYGVHLLWMSRTEKKYYQIEIILPREKILQEMGKKFDFEWDEKPNRSQFTTIDLAFAPGGFISLRLGGSRCLEVATYQAKEAQVSWEFFAKTNHFNPERLPLEEFNDDHFKNLPSKIVEDAKKGKYPLDRWKQYSQYTFPWHFATKMNIEACRISFINGNDIFYNKSDLKTIELNELRDVSVMITLFYKENNKKYQANIRFTQQKRGGKEMPEDDVSIFSDFQKFFLAKTMSTALVVEKEISGFEAYLTNGSKKQSLQIFHQESWMIEANQYSWF